jgi:hypothetical protein
VVKSKTQKRALEGKTYSLFGKKEITDSYYGIIAHMADGMLANCRSPEVLLVNLQKASGYTAGSRKSTVKHIDRTLISSIKKNVRKALSMYTGGVQHHLKTLSLKQRFDEILRTDEEHYHLYMLEIELTNRINRKMFKQSEYKFALIAHCLRDFRPECQAVPGDIEHICRECTEECFINRGSILLKKYNIGTYISITMDQEKLFKSLKARHPSIGALGIACIPELVRGMRLCTKLGIHPVGIPLDANRCSRWMRECLESSFSLKELEDLVK